MASVRQSGTSTELAVRRILRSCGIDYQIKAKDLPGTPDLVNRKDMWAIFVHGCFWHAHENCSLWRIPRNNRAFWRKKFYENRRRDEKNVECLEEMGYSVLVVWQCELRNEGRLKRRIRMFLTRSKSELDKRQRRTGRCGDESIVTDVDR